MLSNVPEFSVLEFSRSIKRTVEDAFGYVRIKGEITGFKRATSGHVYFTLKEGDAVLSAVLFRNQAQFVNFEMGDGLQIVASGRVTTFEGRSNYQIIVEKLEIAGVGAILEMIEKRRQKLLAEGLFDAIHKKPIPFFPRIIGVITSPTGAVIEDIKHRIQDRCPTHLMLYPTLVQGNKAAMEVIAALKFFNRLKKEERPEVIIIARGGGSFEDLLPFSDEDLVREVFKSEIVVISAIGHETDISLLDYVADLRAPTPTAAAELATPVLAELKNQINFLEGKLKILPQNYLAEKLRQLKNLEKYIIDPKIILAQKQERLLFLQDSLLFLTKNYFVQKKQKLDSLQISTREIFQQINLVNQKVEFLFKSIKSRLENSLKEKSIVIKNLEKLLKSNHYQEILKRGFALVKKENGYLIMSKEELKLKDKFTLELADGEVKGEVV